MDLTLEQGGQYTSVLQADCDVAEVWFTINFSFWPSLISSFLHLLSPIYHLTFLSPPPTSPPLLSQVPTPNDLIPTDFTILWESPDQSKLCELCPTHYNTNTYHTPEFILYFLLPTLLPLALPPLTSPCTLFFLFMNNYCTFSCTSSHHTPLCTTSPCTTPYTSAPSQADIVA